jgi:hypothetical protein
MSASQPSPTEFPVRLADYACPLINPPAQRHLFENKIHNIQLAIGRMQPFVLAPGQDFSFWRCALAPTIENGYRAGAMFVNRRVTTSIGGGLCQLSGLLYNLALLAGLDIIERHNHSIDAYGEARYIPLGRDATVAHGHKDLRLRNPHRFPVALQLQVGELEAAGTLWGAQALGCAIRIETALVRTVVSRMRRIADPSLLPGQEVAEPGLTGKVVRAWRVFESPGQPSRREYLSRDRYRATPTVVRRGVALPASWSARMLARLGWHG